MNTNRFIERKLNSDRIKSAIQFKLNFLSTRRCVILKSILTCEKNYWKCAREINPNEMIDEED